MRRGVVVLILCFGTLSAARAQRTLYADASASGSASGESWAHAFTSLQAAFDALQPGDTLLTRGTFFEATILRTDDSTILGDTDPGRPTWIRGDRYAPHSAWAWIGTGQVHALDGVAQLIGTDLRPGSVVYDYKRDDLEGSVTGIDLRRFYSKLPQSGAGVYFGHLRHATDFAALVATPSSWWWDQAGDRVYVNPPAGQAFDPAKAGVCINGFNAISILSSRVQISGVSTLCTPGFALNNGYGMKGMASNLDVIVENADIIDPGWHAVGFEVGAPARCTIRNVRAWSSGVDGSNANNPFVFYANRDQPFSQHLGEDLTFHAYPLLGTDGAPIFAAFRPNMGLSHTTGNTFHRLGGITWRRLHLVDQLAQVEAHHGLELTTSGAAVNANDVPAFQSLEHDSYPVVVEDSVFEGPGAVPGQNIRFERCVFAPGSSRLVGEYRATITAPILLRSCTLEMGSAGSGESAAFINIPGYSRVYLDMTTVHSSHENPLRIFIRTTNGGLYARQCVFSSASPINLLLIWHEGWDTFHTRQSVRSCYLAGPVTPVDHPWQPPRSAQWWTDTIDPGAVFGPQAEFIDPSGSNLRPLPGSALSSARAIAPIPELEALVDIDRLPYNRRYGASQAPCRADVNADGLVTPTDFTAWLAAYNASDPRADINADSVLSPTDFTAWLAAFQAGC